MVIYAGSFIPITLEQLAREQGVLLSDRSTPCRASFQKPGIGTLALDFLALTTSGGGSKPDNGQCVINLFGAEINTASFAMYTFSLSVLVQAVIIISMSGAADHGNYRKTLLLAFAFLGATATMLFLPVIPKVYLLGALLAIIANTCFGASFVLLNSFLPVLVRQHPEVQAEATDSYTSLDESYHEDESLGNSHEIRVDAASPLLARFRNQPSKLATPAFPVQSSAELQLSTRISSHGVGIGYIAAVCLQVLAVFLVALLKGSTFSLRLVLFLIGLWWFVFTIPAALWLRPRPGPPLSGSSDGKDRSYVGYVVYAWRSLGKTILRARHLKDVVLFLAAWFLLSDGIATVSGTAVLFAKTELHMKTPKLALINVIVTLTGILGAFLWNRISRFFRIRPAQTIVVCICIFELIPLYGLLGYIPFIARNGVFGLQSEWEMYPLGAVYGFVLGGLSSYCRSLFGELIPPGSEAAFYALYAITDKGSSVFGPAIVGAITDRYGEIRPAFLFLAILIAIPLPLMAMVDVERGKRDGAEMARVLEGKSNGREAQQRILMIDEEAGE